jgi:hypothetical protein
MKRKRKTNGFKVCHCGLQQGYEDMRDKVLSLQEDVNLWRTRHSELFMKLNPITDASESQREAAGTADEKPDGQAENKVVTHSHEL